MGLKNPNTGYIFPPESTGPPPSQRFLNFLSGEPGFEDFIRRGINRTEFGVHDVDRLSRNAAGTFLGPLAGFGGTSSALGFGSLNDILFSRGRTDPQAFNRQLSSIDRTTQGNVQQISEMMARLGLTGSGVGQAHQVAALSSGANQRSQAIAQENALAEARKREDLNLFLRLIIDPSLTALGVERGIAVNRSQQQSNENAALIAALAQLAGGGGG